MTLPTPVAGPAPPADPGRHQHTTELLTGTRPRGRSSAHDTRSLHALAHFHGVQRRYTAADGRRRTVADAVLVGVLGALGVEVRHPKDAAGAWQAAQHQLAAEPLPPVTVYRPSGHQRATVPISPLVASTGRWVSLTAEDGTAVRRRLAEATCTNPAPDDGQGHRLAATAIDLGILARSLPGGRLLPGYHQLALDTAGGTESTLVIAAPDRCPAAEPSWGIGAPLYAVRGAAAGGTGTLGDLGDLAAWVESLGGRVTGTLPLYAGFLDGPEPDPSPYRPASRLAWNEVYLDLRQLPELALAPEAAELMCSPQMVAHRRRLEQSPLAHLPEVLAANRRVLQPVAVAFLTAGTGSSRRQAFDRWVALHPDMVAYARFRAEREHAMAGREPGQAPTPHPIPAPAPAPAANQTLPQALALASADPAVAYHLYTQWLVDQQLGQVASHHSLYLDLPVGVHPDGFDPWWEAEAFVTGASIGSPPDTFFADGQRWGLPPLHPERIRHQGYRHLVDVVRRAMSYAGILRLDHVMGLHRLWVVPDGLPATEGAYVRYHAEELRAVVTLEASRTGTAVVGEDLGTVPGSVRRAMGRDGMLRSSVWQFDATADDPTPAPLPGSLATLGTHDLAPFAAVLGDNPALARSLGPDRYEALARCLTSLAAGPAAVVLVDLADLWLEEVPQNLPGQPSAGNFRLRSRRTLAELSSDHQVLALLHRVDAARHLLIGASA